MRHAHVAQVGKHGRHGAYDGRVPRGCGAWRNDQVRARRLSPDVHDAGTGTEARRPRFRHADLCRRVKAAIPIRRARRQRKIAA